MIYITGDIHGDQFKWNERIDPFMSSEKGIGQTIIVLGDFGVGFWDGAYWSEEMFYDWLAERPYTVLFVDGNHENFDKLNAYPVSEWKGGKVHCIRGNIIHLMRGEIYQMEGSCFFAFGGAVSIDRARRKEGESWWQQEIPDEEEYEHGLETLEAHGNRVDYILTHTAPKETVLRLTNTCPLEVIEKAAEDELRNRLEYVRETVKYKRWFFGHFHQDASLWRNQVAVYNSILDLDGNILRRWQGTI